MSERYPSLFSPVKIGGVTLKNRVILAAMGGTNLIHPGTGEFNAHVRDYYLDRARGNVGLIIPGVTFVNSGGWLHEKEAAFLGPVKELMDETGWDEDKIRSAIKFFGDNIEDLDSKEEGSSDDE